MAHDDVIVDQDDVIKSPSLRIKDQDLVKTTRNAMEHSKEGTIKASSNQDKIKIKILLQDKKGPSLLKDKVMVTLNRNP